MRKIKKDIPLGIFLFLLLVAMLSILVSAINHGIENPPEDFRVGNNEEFMMKIIDAHIDEHGFTVETLQGDHLLGTECSVTPLMTKDHQNKLPGVLITCRDGEFRVYESFIYGYDLYKVVE